MKFRSVRILAILSVVAGATRVAAAAEPASPWSFSISGGDSIDEIGSLRASRSTDFADLSVLDPTLSGTSGTLRLDKLRYEDLFRRRFDTGLELDYSFNDNLQSFGRLGYSSLGGRTTTIGQLDGGPGFDSVAALRAHWAGADNLSFQLGSRYFFSTGSDWRPFAGLAIGATHLDAMRASITSPDLATDLNNLHFTRSGTVFSQSLQTGVEYTPTSALGLRFGIDIEHVGRPHNTEDPQLEALGYDPNDQAHSMWSVPVSIAANYRF